MPYWIGEHADLVTLSGEGRPYPTSTPDRLIPNNNPKPPSPPSPN